MRPRTRLFCVAADHSPPGTNIAFLPRVRIPVQASISNVEVIRSPRRRKTIEARLVDGTLRIAIPDHLSADEESRWIEVMRQRFSTSAKPEDIDLGDRAARLVDRYALPAPSTITWSARQTTRWGSCSPDSGRIRISNRVAGCPPWVLDYVIIHELAHLSEPKHNKHFWDLVNRYPLAERARGYLMARADMGG